MKQNQQSALWHRCGTCGTIFMSMDELIRHMATHKPKQFVPRRGVTIPTETAKPPSLNPENASELVNNGA